MQKPKDTLNIEKFFIGTLFIAEITPPYKEQGHDQNYRIAESDFLNHTLEDNYFDVDFPTIEKAKNYLSNGFEKFANKVIEGLNRE